MTTRTLYYAPGACSLAAHIILEESGLPFEGVKLNLAAGDQRAPEYLAINERGRVPALVEDGWVLTECAAILRHVARTVIDELDPADRVVIRALPSSRHAISARLEQELRAALRRTRSGSGARP